uniref:Uncharacterized protein n=1 Tax=Panagrolaimus sp. JU765 TaxID=591449 RepID=A0AC34RMV2_9BILA
MNFGVLLSFCWLIFALWTINDAKPAVNQVVNTPSQFLNAAPAKMLNVEQNETGVIFKDDADVNISLPTGKFKLIVYDPSVQEGDNQKATYFCFGAKSASQPGNNPNCPKDYCEIKVSCSRTDGELLCYTYLGEKRVVWGNELVEIEVQQNEMYVIGQESESANVCQINADQDFLPKDVELHNSTSVDGMDAGIIAGVTVGAILAVGAIGSTIFIVKHCLYYKKKKQLQETKKTPEIKPNSADGKEKQGMGELENKAEKKF